MQPVIHNLALSVEDVSALLHALIGYYRVQEQVIPDTGMLLISRLTSLHAEMIQEEAQAFLYRSKS